MTPAQIAAVEASLVSIRFLGCATRVAPKLAAILAAVERALVAVHAAAAPGVPFSLWHNVHGVGGYRARAGFHGKGLAVDVDYTLNPYVATRTGARLGGEAAGAALPVRKPAVEACDRACAQAYGPGASADLSARRRGESTAAVFDRFELVNVAVRGYFGRYFGADARTIKRRPVAHFGSATYETFTPLIPELLPGVALADVPLQVLRDYEAFRVPTVVGMPELRPAETRNPARGLMNLRREVVLAMCDVGGLRWGMSDFGAAESGDGMHFDTASRIYAP